MATFLEELETLEANATSPRLQAFLHRNKQIIKQITLIRDRIEGILDNERPSLQDQLFLDERIRIINRMLNEEIPF